MQPNVFCESCAALEAAAVGPVLSAVAGAPGTLDLSWTWDGEDPPFWWYQRSLDGGATWEDAGTDIGTDRDNPGVDDAVAWRIIGSLDAGVFTPVTEFSNAVNI